MTLDATRFYIDGSWVEPNSSQIQPVVNPATESSIGDVALGNSNDVDAAVAAAKAAFPAYARTTIKQRLGWLNYINDELIARNDEIADAITAQMGAPKTMSRAYQASSGPQHFGEIIRLLETYPFEIPMGTTTVRREPIGVCALITPWNWPINQIATKVAPALAAGCTVVLKPSELAPLDAAILADIIDKSGLPAGVFNLIHGDGLGVGAPLVEHKDVDMISFTGSTRAGVAISKAAAPDVKRVALELGGKSAAIVLEDANFEAAIPSIVGGVMLNTGQSCNARTRILVPRSKYELAASLAAKAANAVTVGDPTQDETAMGPVANRAQYDRVVAMIKAGQAEGATVLAGGPEAPAGLETGLYVKPTIFGDVTRDMSVAREEIFGPVISLMAYDSLDEAISIANDSEYGLSGAVWSASHDSACDVAAQLRTGMVHLNGAGLDSAAPFGGYKKSGNGREWGVHGLDEFIELKSVYGANP
ncbi:MAG: aldehyde dehydrogenase family protein [Litorimonas sp.]